MRIVFLTSIMIVLIIVIISIIFVKIINIITICILDMIAVESLTIMAAISFYDRCGHRCSVSHRPSSQRISQRSSRDNQAAILTDGYWCACRLYLTGGEECKGFDC